MAVESSPGEDAQFSDYNRLVAEHRDAVKRCEDDLIALAATELQLRKLAAAMNGNATPRVGAEIKALRAELAEYSGTGQPLSAPNLTNREFEVFELIGKGLTTPQIAERLSLAVSTVETYRDRIKHKLNLSCANALTREAVLWVSSQAPQREQLRSGRA